MALGEWSVQWLYNELDPRDIDPITLTWWMHRRVDAGALPPGRVVVQFDHTAPERITAWIVLDRGEASVCKQHPGYDSDVIVTCTTGDLVRRVQRRRVVGPRRRDRVDPRRRPAAPRPGLPRWFLGSPFGHLVAERRRWPTTPVVVPPSWSLRRRWRPVSAMNRRPPTSAFGALVEDDGAPAVDERAVLDVGAHGPGEHGDLEVAALAPQVVDVVAVADPDHVLVDDRPLVEVGGDVVGGDADQLDAALVRLVVRAGAAERRAGTSGGC